MADTKISLFPTAPLAISGTDRFTGLQGGANVNFSPTQVETWIMRSSGAADTALAAKAPLASPTLTGVPLAPTAAPGTNTTQIATTQFVTSAVTAGTAGVASFNGRVGAVVPASGDYNLDLIADGTTNKAYTATEKAKVANVPSDTNASLALKAPLASPALTGTPTGPTATAGTNTTQLATTAFVQAAVTGGTAGVASFNTRTGAVMPANGDYTAAQITTDSTHLFVTAAQISAWNAGSTGLYSDPAARFFDVRDYDIIPNDAGEETDNTTKMDALIADIDAVRGGVIYFPEVGVYYLSINLPSHSPGAPGGYRPYPLEIRGSVPPYMSIGTITGGLVRYNTEWTAIRTTTSTPAIHIPGSGGLTSYWGLVVTRNIEFQSTGSAPYCVDFGAVGMVDLDQTLISNSTWGTGSFPYSNVGLRMPLVNNGGSNVIGTVAVVGFETGWLPGEHLVANHIMAFHCVNGAVHYGNYHLNIIQRYQTAHNDYDIVTSAANGIPYVNLSINQFDYETGATIANILDSGLLRGNIYYGGVRAGVGFWNNFVAVGHNPFRCKLARIGRLFQEFDQPGPLLSGATRVDPTTSLTAWGQTYGQDIWYSYSTSAVTAGTGGTPASLPAGVDGWIAQKYDADSRGGFVGFQPTTGPGIGFYFALDGEIVFIPAGLTPVNTGVFGVHDTFYRLNRVGDDYLIESSDDLGATWNTEYTEVAPFGLSVPAGDYSAIIAQGVGGSAELTGGVFFPQVNFSGTALPLAPAPTSMIVDDTLDTADWTNASGFTNPTDYEYRIGGSGAFTGITAKPHPVGDVAIAVGALEIRTKAVVGVYQASTSITNGTAFTVASAPDTTPPMLLSATVENATPTHVDLVFDEAMDPTWSATSAWGVTGGHAVTAVTRLTATTGYLTVSPAFVAAEAQTLSYTAPGTNDMKDLATTPNLLVNIAAEVIVNHVGSAGGFIDLVPSSISTTEYFTAGAAPKEWDHVGASPAYATSGKKVASGTDGGAIYVYDATLRTCNVMLGFRTTNTEPTAHNDFLLHIIFDDVLDQFNIWHSGSPVSSGAVTTGDWVRIYRDTTSSQITVDKSSNSGASWSNIFTSSGLYTAADLWIAFWGGASPVGKMLQPMGDNVV